MPTTDRDYEARREMDAAADDLLLEMAAVFDRAARLEGYPCAAEKQAAYSELLAWAERETPPAVSGMSELELYGLLLGLRRAQCPDERVDFNHLRQASSTVYALRLGAEWQRIAADRALGAA